jgi:hypothetical protein
MKEAAQLKAALVVRVLEHRDFAVALPKLYVATVDQSLGVFLRGLIVRADQFDCPEKVTVDPNNVRSIPDHWWPPFPPKNVTEIVFCRSGPGHSRGGPD